MTDLTGGTDRRDVLGGFLDWYRGVCVAKLGGLTLEQTTQVRMPSGTTMLGIVQHLAWDERIWFDHYLRGGAHGCENSESFVIGPDATIESVVADYEAACASSRAVVAATPFDARAAIDHDVFGAVTLEWIVLHMIEETARHAGHLDILRELTDGRAGD